MDKIISTLDDIISEWAKDSQIDDCDLSGEALKTSKLHHKYYTSYLNENAKLRALNAHYKQLYADRVDWMFGNIDEDTLRKRGWGARHRAYVHGNDKDAKKMYIEADEELIVVTKKIGLQTDKVEFLKSILSELMYNRRHAISGAITMHTFENKNS